MISYAASSLLGFVFWILAARHYPAAAVGTASAAVSAMMLLSLLATLGLDYAVIRFLPNANRAANTLVNSCLTIAGLAAIVIALIFVGGLRLWSPGLLFLREEPIYLSAFVLFTAVLTLYTIVYAVFIAARRSSFNLAQVLTNQLIEIALIIPFAAFFASFGIFASWGLSEFAALIVAMLLLFPRIQVGYRPSVAIDWNLVSEMVQFSLSNYVANLLWYAPTFILPIMVVNLVGAEANAFFYIAWAIASVLFWIPVGTSLSLFADSSHDTDRLGQNFRGSLKLTFLILIPAIILIFLIGGKILHLFGGGYSEGATKLLWILGLSAMPLSINAMYFGLKRVEKKMKGVISSSAFITAATLVLSWFLMPRIGILGAGVAWLSSQTVVSLVIVCSRLRSSRQPSSIDSRFIN
jgi:O-antigen/teichoic acid export membrane protein